MTDKDSSTTTLLQSSTGSDDARHFGDILRDEAKRLRALADRLDPDGAAQAAPEPTPEMLAQFETGLGAIFSAKEAFLFGWEQAIRRAPQPASNAYRSQDHVREALDEVRKDNK